MVRQVLRRVGIDPAAEGGAISEENIRLLMDIGEERGAIDSTEKEMIENVFDFNDLTAEDVMIHRTEIVSLWVEDSDEDDLRTIEDRDSPASGLDEDLDDVIGILYSRDYYLNSRKERPFRCGNCCARPILCPALWRQAIFSGICRARRSAWPWWWIEYGGTSGLIAMEDLPGDRGRATTNSTPRTSRKMIRLEENLWRVAGSAELDDLAEALGVEFPPDEESETLGGLVFAQLSVIPEDGSCPVVDAVGLRIQVERLSERRVEWALVSKLPAQDPGKEKSGFQNERAPDVFHIRGPFGAEVLVFQALHGGGDTAAARHKGVAGEGVHRHDFGAKKPGEKPPNSTMSPTFLPGAGMMRTAVVLELTMPMAASSAMMAEMVPRWYLRARRYHVQAHRAERRSWLPACRG